MGNIYIEGKYLKEEEIDFKKFKKLADRYPKMFKKYRQTEYGVPFDILNLTYTGGTYAIELKSRKKKYNDCFIEWEKFSKLRELWRNNCVLPVYICFYEDETYMWLLNEVCGITPYLNTSISDREGGYYEVDRIGLKYSEAYRFDKDFNVTYRPNNINKSATLPKANDEELMDAQITKYNWKKI
jgi:hypothetical protein